MENNIMIWALWNTAGATAVIAIFAAASFWLASKIKKRDDEFRQQVSDLYKAIVISNFRAPDLA